MDDERTIVTLLWEYLASKGFRVLTARDGQAGVETARSSAADHAAFKAAGAPEHLLCKILEVLTA